ncbi:putative Heat shock protein 70 family [Helianthus anomalus]
MVNEADKFAKEEKEKRDAIDTQNQTEKQLNGLRDKVSAYVKEKLEAKLSVSLGWPYLAGQH